MVDYDEEKALDDWKLSPFYVAPDIKTKEVSWFIR